MSRIMLVDDERMIRELYSTMLEMAGHEVVDTAASGQEAVDKFDEILPPPDIILMDFRMPGKDGLQATKEILGSRPDTKVLMVTADENVLSRCLEEGAYGYLEKPFTLDTLLASVDRVLAGERVEAGRNI